ncbi:MAG: NAD(P)-dependent oxidoreductase, partial [Chloroflexi bacterium]|nr:NAD(P)-dependent oxidoreductase [Chloroflexota bacterium]
MSYYAAFLDLTDRPCLVVGGDSIAADKAEGLLQAGAQVTVLAA